METRVHANDPHYGADKVDRFELRGYKGIDDSPEPAFFPRCTYCGSWDIDTLIKAFHTVGTKWSGADWKYGWPHKFYVEIPTEPWRKCISSKSGPEGKTYEYMTSTFVHGKFYNLHLKEATPEQWRDLQQYVEPITHIHFEMKDSQLRYLAHANYQGWGDIEKDPNTGLFKSVRREPTY